MKSGFDFSRTPGQRRRAREHRFYRHLAGAALLGVLPVLALGWRIDRHSEHLEAGNLLLAAELQALQPQQQQAGSAREHIAALQTRLSGLNALEQRRMQAARLLRASARAAMPSARLYRIALLDQRAELRGHAGETREVQAFAEALSHAGLDGVAVQDLRIAKGGDAPGEQGRYDFTLAAPLLPAWPAGARP
ncbi:pilus assembly protein [Herbaspirillum sp. LeCh32-8]|uniref:pilus assembly protein n=1 Tax=Herbaspirillum sp. LeCh32-8 TaxID=2821356 RepID=UPI001AEB0897|nr:pilus assembly protein [Herbaspirillum sp. LeCh32-8]MBP0600099.1 pilus assembly protein [Herbaspirillum sp. LeCh32-8]